MQYVYTYRTTRMIAHPPWITHPTTRAQPGGIYIFVALAYRHFITWGALDITPPPATKAHPVEKSSKVEKLTPGCASICVINSSTYIASRKVTRNSDDGSERQQWLAQ